jgi:hypothetical protein
MIEPKEYELNGKNYLLSKFPAVAGREIICKYPLSGIPKLGDYGVNEETMLKLMSYVAVVLPGDVQLRLTTRALVDNHVGSWENLMRIEGAMLEYNCSFFQDGRVSDFLVGFAQKVPALISKMLTDSLRQSSPTEKQPFTN